MSVAMIYTRINGIKKLKVVNWAWIKKQDIMCYDLLKNGTITLYKRPKGSGFLHLE